MYILHTTSKYEIHTDWSKNRMKMSEEIVVVCPRTTHFLTLWSVNLIWLSPHVNWFLTPPPPPSSVWRLWRRLAAPGSWSINIDRILSSIMSSYRRRNSPRCMRVSLTSQLCRKWGQIINGFYNKCLAAFCLLTRPDMVSAAPNEYPQAALPAWALVGTIDVFLGWGGVGGGGSFTTPAD